MNPFDLPGPEFLAFYWVLIIVGLAAVWWWRAQTDVTGAPARNCRDPYQLAFLRDGHPEVVRVALLSLVEERILSVKKREFSIRPKARAKLHRPRRPRVEEDVLLYLDKQSATVDGIIDAAVGDESCELYRGQLEQLGFLRSTARLDSVRHAADALAVLLAGVALLKLVVALGRGRHNVAFLILSAATAVWLALRARKGVPLRTTRGREALEAAEALLAGAHQRLKEASAAVRGEELAWIAAAFGFSVFNYPELNFAFWPALAYTSPKEIQQALGGGSGGFSSFWSSGGSSCGGASSCGGGGGGCGGGGGGGGCGGCGGGG